MTTDTTATEEKPEVTPDTPDTTEEKPNAEDVEAWPQRVSLDWLRDVLDNTGSRFGFEEWAHNFWLAETCDYHTARLQLRKLERLGIAPDSLLVERARLDTVKPQVEEIAFLAAAHPEHDALEVSDPMTAKYLALWLWATGGGRKYWATDGQPLPPERDASLPIQWADVLAPDLLSLPAFGCTA